MNQSVGGKATIYANKNVRLAVSEAVNKQSYVDAFYSGLGKVPTGFMPPATTGFKAETLPAYSVSQAKADLAASGVTGSALNIDLYYPSNVVRPYMPDPKGIAQAIAQDLQTVGLHRESQDRGLARRLRQRRHEWQAPALPLRLDLRLGRRRQLPLHGLVRLPGWPAEPAVRLEERRRQRPQLKALAEPTVDERTPTGRRSIKNASKSPTASINFVTAHDGFTLRDLVSYNEKHNEANGEGNADGETNNNSWNCGAEGETEDKTILSLRAQQQRNFLATLLLSREYR